MSAGVLHGRQRLFHLMATVGGGSEGTYVVAASSRRPLVRWFNTSAPTSSLPQGGREVTQGVQKRAPIVNVLQFC